MLAVHGRYSVVVEKEWLVLVLIQGNLGKFGSRLQRAFENEHHFVRSLLQTDSAVMQILENRLGVNRKTPEWYLLEHS